MSRGKREDHINSFVGGMNKDASKTLLTPDKYRNAENLRVTNIEGEGNGALVNIKGNEYKLSIGTDYDIWEVDPWAWDHNWPNAEHWIEFKIDGDATKYAINVPAGTFNLTAVATDFEYPEYFKTIIEILNTQTLYENYGGSPGSKKISDLGFYAYLGDNGRRIEFYNRVNTITSIKFLDAPRTTTNTQATILELGGNGLRVIGSTLLRDDIIVFLASTGNINRGEIWKLTYDEISDSVVPTVVYERMLGLDINYPVEAIARYETNKTQRLYWTDFKNEVRSLNISQDDPNNIDPSLLDLSPSIKLSRPTLSNLLSSGTLPVGVYQYCYRVIKGGVVSRFSPLSDAYNVVKGSIKGVLWDLSPLTQYNGRDLGESSGKSLELVINNLDPDYDTVEVASIYYGAAGALPIVNIFLSADIPINGTLEFTHSGSESNISFSAEEILKFSSSFSKAKTLSVKDNRLFAGNVITAGTADLKFNARAYRYNSAGNTYVSNTAKNQGPNDPISDLTLQSDIDAINPYNADVHMELTDPNAYAYYDTGGRYLGGRGPNVSYKFVMRDVHHTAASLDPQSGETPSQPKDTKEHASYNVVHDFGEDSQYNSNNSTWRNHKDITYNACLKGYQRGEVYRFGVVLFDLKGRPGFVNWIGDIKFPNNYDFDNTFPNAASVGDQEYGYSFCKTNGNQTNNTRALGIEFNISIPSGIRDNVSGAQIVRMKRTGADKTILGTGIVNSSSRYYFAGTGYREPSLRVDPDSDPFWEGEDSDFYGLGVNGERITNNFSSSDENVESGSASFDRTGQRTVIYTENTTIGTFDCPDFQFLGAPSFKAGDSLRFLGIGTYRIGITESTTLPAKDAWQTMGNWPNHTSGVFNGLYRFPANPDSSTWAATKHTAPLVGSKIRLYPAWHLDRRITTAESGSGKTVYTTLASRTHTLTEGVEANRGENVTINEREFKNWFVSHSVTGDADNNTAIYHKWCVTGEGNKTYVFESSKAFPWANGGAWDLNRDNFEYRIHATGTPHTRIDVTYEGPSGTAESGTIDLPIMQYIRNVSNQYGGNTFSSRKSNVYIPCSDIIDTGPYGSISALEVYRGDTFVTMYCNTKSFKRTDNNGNRIAHLFPVETTLNTYLREGDFFPLFDYSTAPGRTVDDFILDSVLVFSQDKDIETYLSDPETTTEVQEFDNRVYASDEKLNGELQDSWRSFGDTNFLDVNGLHGPINKLIEMQDQIYFLQDSGVGMLSINPRAMVSTGGVGELQLGEGGVLDDFRYITTEFGSQQQYAVAVSGNYFYFMDSNNRKLFQFNGSALTPFSIQNGMNSYFQDDTLQNAYLYDNPFMGLGINTIWDRKYNEVLFTFHKNTLNTISGTPSFDNSTNIITISEDVRLLINPGDMLLVTDSKGYTTFVEVVSISPSTNINIRDGYGLYNGDVTVKYLGKNEITDDSITYNTIDSRIEGVDSKVCSVLKQSGYVRVNDGTFDITVQINSVDIVNGYVYAAGLTSIDFSIATIYGYETQAETICISEDQGVFTGFYSFAPNVYISNYNFMWSFNPYNLTDMYMHDKANYGLFYGGYYDSLLSFLCNIEPRTTKVFDNATFQLESTDSDGTQNTTAVDNIRFYTDYQNTDWIDLDPTVGNTRNLRRTEREWQLQIPRNVVTDATGDIFNSSNWDKTRSFKDRIRDKYMTIDLKIKNTSSNVKKLLHYVHTFFRVSKR